MRARSTPEGYHSLTPYLLVDDVEAALRFYTEVFQAKVMIRREIGGRLVLADLLIGDSHMQISDPANHTEMTMRGGVSGLRVYVEDVDAAFRRALDGGAKETSAVEDKYWGDRAGDIIDPFGHHWKISQHKEDVSSKVIERRMHEKEKDEAR